MQTISLLEGRINIEQTILDFSFQFWSHTESGTVHDCIAQLTGSKRELTSRKAVVLPLHYVAFNVTAF